MESYDYIFAGAGCSGLSLVHYLLESDLKDAKILMIDPQGDQIPDKTWCYWAEKPLDIHPSKNIHCWNNLSFVADHTKITKNLGRLNYYHLNSHDFYNSIFKKITKSPNVTLIQDEVWDLTESSESIKILTKNGKKFQTSFVFDSRLNENEFKNTNSLKQIFSGWRIKTQSEVFDPTSLILMEFPNGKSSQFDFFYILPFSKTEALVEFTAYSKDSISKDDLNSTLETYLRNNLNDISFEITFQESGIIPMSNRKASKNPYKRVIKLGTAAGWTKASTGYTFHTIQKNCKEIVQALSFGKIHELQLQSSSRFSFYDNVLLNVAHKWPDQLQSLFLNLFTTSSADLVLRFLSEETSFREEITLLSKLKFPIFIKSLLNYESH
ncbi:lycopene cyclase family protein [Algoriphagus sp.]|uniref:lycopene cyclase family protein n=1 Tax=Algoriphagus sp. TaxID=1872435 RepID=UPI00391C34C5